MPGVQDCRLCFRTPPIPKMTISDSAEPAFASHAAFDDYADNYEQALNKGVALSGESPDYFAEQRVDYTASWLKALGVPPPVQVADFGCGVGSSTPHFRRCFPEARLLGLDVAAGSIKRARDLHGEVASFAILNEFERLREHELVYCNGVFHHIVPDDRLGWAVRVGELLAPGGYFALWENNPWNPGTRIVSEESRSTAVQSRLRRRRRERCC